MRRQAGWIIALVVAWLWAGPVSAQNVSEALKLVPEDATAFGLVNRVGETFGRIEDLGKKVVPFPFSFRDLVRKELGIDKGLDEKGDLVVVIFSRPGEEQVDVYCVPVTDYKEFLQGLKPGEAREGVTEITLANDTKMLAANRGKYALLAKPDNAAALKKILAGGKNIVAATKPLHSWLAETSYSLVLTPSGMKETLAGFRKGLEKAKDDIPEQGKAALPMLEGLSRFLESASDEVTHFGAGARLAPAGSVTFSFKSVFKKGGSFAKSADKVKGIKGGPLGGLPGGPYAFAFGGALPDDLTKAMAELNVQIIKSTAANPDPEVLRKLEKAYHDLIRGVEGMGFRMGKSKEGEPLFAGMMGVMHVQDASAFLANYEKGIQAYIVAAEATKSPVLGNIEVKKVKVGDRPALEVVVEMGQELGEAEKKVLEAMFGPGGKVTATIVAVSDRTLLLGYLPAKEFQKVLPKAGDSGLAEEALTAKTVKLFPKDAQWVVLVRPKGLVELVQQVAQEFGGRQLPLKDLPNTPPLGIAVRVSATGADMEMVMPAGLLDIVRQLMPRPEARLKQDAPPRTTGR